MLPPSVGHTVRFDMRRNHPRLWTVSYSAASGVARPGRARCHCRFVVTACLGGVIRDVLAGEPTIVVRPDLYVTAAAFAAGSYVALVPSGLAPVGAAATAFVLGFGLRGLAIVRNISLPAYPG
jgi:uncharacterized membrane protein YeiH